MIERNTISFKETERCHKLKDFDIDDFKDRTGDKCGSEEEE